MTISVRELLELPGLGLRLVAGEGGLDKKISWAHASELADPTPWLSGGELILTTGLAVKGTPARQRAYLTRLKRAGVTGLGFGVGFGFEAVPLPLRRAADKDDLPIVEIPYPVPFIAVTKAIWAYASEQRVKDLQLSLDVHERLAQVLSAGGGPADVLEEVVTLAPGWAYLFSPSGRLVAAAGERAAPSVDEVWRGLPPGFAAGTGPSSSGTVAPEGASLALAVTAGGRHEGVLVFGRPARLESSDRLVVHHAVTVLGSLLAMRRAILQAERRVAGDLLVEAVEGRLTGPELARRLELAGLGSGRLVSLVVVTDEEPTEDVVLAIEWSADSPGQIRSAIHDGRILLVVPQPTAMQLAEITAKLAHVERVAVGDAVAPADLKRSYLSASLALKAAPAGRPVVSSRDLGSYGLLSAQPREVIEGYVASVIGPLLERDRERGSDLVASVRAFVEAGAHWEEGAAVLGVHRHTLRYRINQAQELIDRDLGDAQDRMEVWLALRAADLLQA
jgi:purine catabolism regulator